MKSLGRGGNGTWFGSTRFRFISYAIEYIEKVEEFLPGWTPGEDWEETNIANMIRIMMRNLKNTMKIDENAAAAIYAITLWFE